MSTTTRGTVAAADRAAPLDAVALRRDFPILTQRVRGKPLVYLDNAATSQKPQVVIDALQEYYETTNANIHRGIHYLSEKGHGGLRRRSGSDCHLHQCSAPA